MKNSLFLTLVYLLFIIFYLALQINTQNISSDKVYVNIYLIKFYINYKFSFKLILTSYIIKELLKRLWLHWANPKVEYENLKVKRFEANTGRRVENLSARS